MDIASNKKEIVSIAIEIAIKVLLLGIVLYWAFMILKPFIVLVIWAIIIAVSLAPFIDKMDKRIAWSRSKIVWTLIFTAIFALVVPTYFLADSMISSSQDIAHQLKEGTLVVPPPSDKVAEWPLIGKKTHALWSEASTNLESTLQHYQPQLKEYAGKIASTIGGALSAVLQFVVALIIAAVFLTNSVGGVKVYQAIARRLVGEKGVEWAQLSAMTVRSVVQGILGIALIQSGLSLIGLVIIDVPFAPFWAFVVLFLAIIQLPPILILGPIAAYVFSYAETTPAIIFAIYAVIVSMSDAFLKPLLLGRGVDIPMLVILLGAIGGMIMSGIIGLFVGAVILALSYKLFITWLEAEVQEELAAVQEETK
jgi:predicted PurR-regulated permease PerM